MNELEIENEQDTVTISKKEYDELVNDSSFLFALQAAGVDNWEGYDEAIRIQNEEIEEDEE